MTHMYSRHVFTSPEQMDVIVLVPDQGFDFNAWDGQ